MHALHCWPAGTHCMHGAHLPAQALRSFRRELDAHSVQRVRAVATAAVREAGPAAAGTFLEQVGIHLERIHRSGGMGLWSLSGAGEAAAEATAAPTGSNLMCLAGQRRRLHSVVLACSPRPHNLERSL